MSLVDTCDALYGGGAAEATRAAEALSTLALDLRDVQQAMPALAAALTRDEPGLLLAAAQALHDVAAQGGQAGLAFPALFALRQHPHSALRRAVWDICAELTHTENQRLRACLSLVRDDAAQALQDVDPVVRAAARRASDRLATLPR